jgi:hypothetical protein
MIWLFLLMLMADYQTASDETVVIDAHPACAGVTNPTLKIDEKILCVPANSAFKDGVFKNGFE